MIERLPSCSAEDVAALRRSHPRKPGNPPGPPACAAAGLSCALSDLSPAGWSRNLDAGPPVVAVRLRFDGRGNPVPPGGRNLSSLGCQPQVGRPDVRVYVYGRWPNGSAGPSGAWDHGWALPGVDTPGWINPALRAGRTKSATAGPMPWNGLDTAGKWPGWRSIPDVIARRAKLSSWCQPSGTGRQGRRPWPNGSAAPSGAWDVVCRLPGVDTQAGQIRPPRTKRPDLWPWNGLDTAGKWPGWRSIPDVSPAGRSYPAGVSTPGRRPSRPKPPKGPADRSMDTLPAIPCNEIPGCVPMTKEKVRQEACSRSL